MKPVKLKELVECLKKAVKDGYGDCDVYLISDDEGNDYRPLYYNTPMTEKERVMGFMDMSCSGIGLCYDPEKAVLLG